MTSGDSPARAPEELNWWQRAVHSGTGQAVRWVAVLGLVLGRWVAGVPSSFTGWLPVLILAVLLLLPDADSVAFGGVQLEMRRTREEVAGLRNEVMQFQVAQARASSIGELQLVTDNPEAARQFGAAVGLPVAVAASEAAPSEPYDPGIA